VGRPAQPDLPSRAVGRRQKQERTPERQSGVFVRRRGSGLTFLLCAEMACADRYCGVLKQRKSCGEDLTPPPEAKQICLSLRTSLELKMGSVNGREHIHWSAEAL
jgi:hypothetical protein